MGLLRRLVSLIRSLTKALVTPAEDPRQRRVSPLEREAELLTRVKQGIVQIEASKHRLQLQARQMRGKLTEWEDQARRHLLGGREDLARQALRSFRTILQECQALDQQIAGLEQEEKMLTVGEQRLAAKMEALRSRQEAISARYAASEAQALISEALTGLSGELTDLSLSLESAQQKTEEMQSRASAIDELVESGTLEDLSRPRSDAVQRELDKLGAGQAIEDKLEAMKRELERDRTPRAPGLRTWLARDGREIRAPRAER